jgi:hypothetical protein
MTSPNLTYLCPIGHGLFAAREDFQKIRDLHDQNVPNGGDWA